MNGWIGRVWYRHTMEYYSALERKEVMTSALTGIKLENIMPLEINQMPKDKYWMMLLR